MRFALVLSGGIGERMGRDVPKQYIVLAGRPMIFHVLEMLEEHPLVDKIAIVASGEWQPFLDEWMEREGISKFAGYADAGESRQLSVRNGYARLKELGAQDDDVVVMFESCRPGVSSNTVSKIIDGLTPEVDLVDAVLPIYEAIYSSPDGVTLDGVLDRTKVLIGMEPTAVRFGKHYRCNMETAEDELGRYRGTIDFALAKGYAIKTVEGDANGFKITTEADLERYMNVLGNSAL